MAVKLTNKQKELIEKFGVVQEHMGLAPASARVNALLTVCDDLELTFDEIRDTLKLSKSAASNAINNLLTLDRIDYKTKLGDRKRYFYSKLDKWKDKFKTDIQALRSYCEVINEIRANRTKETTDFNEKLEGLSEFMEYFISESVNLIDNWKN